MGATTRRLGLPVRAAALGAAAALLLMLAGCGGGSGRLSKSEYEQELQAQGKTLKNAFQGIDVSSGNLTEIGAQIGQLQAKLERSATEIDKLQPPDDAAADNKKIAAALHKFADEFGKMKAAAQSGDPEKMQAIQREITSAPEVKQAVAATRDLKKKGYKVGSLGQ